MGSPKRCTVTKNVIIDKYRFIKTESFLPSFVRASIEISSEIKMENSHMLMSVHIQAEFDEVSSGNSGSGPDLTTSYPKCTHRPVNSYVAGAVIVVIDNDNPSLDAALASN